MKGKTIFLLTAAIIGITAGSVSLLGMAGQEEDFQTAVNAEADPAGVQHERGGEPDYRMYSSFGLEYQKETDTLFYKGEKVRYFLDEYALGSDDAVVCEYLNEAGTIDIYAQRDLSDTERRADGSFDPAGRLTGVKAYSQEEFDSRDLEAIRNPVSQGVESGVPLDKTELYREYEDFGLSYDSKKDKLYYQGKSVRYFLDVYTSNQKDFSGGGFEGSMCSMVQDEAGEIDVYTVRNFDTTDKDGTGVLTGIEVFSQKEYDERTAEWKED